MTPAKRSMRRTADYEHRYTASNGFAARARVRVFEPVLEEIGFGPVVVVSEPDQADYDGPSVTNNIEQVAGELVMRFALPGSQTVFIEHYPPEAEHAAPAQPRAERETFDLVTFDREDPKPRLVLGRWILELGEPIWQQIERADVELLIGRPLDDPEGR
jgi:hypothetical protein